MLKALLNIIKGKVLYKKTDVLNTPMAGSITVEFDGENIPDVNRDIISFEDKKWEIEMKREDKRILDEIIQKQKEMIYYGIGGELSSSISIDEYVDYLCTDIRDDSWDYFYDRWLGFLKSIQK